MYNMIYRTAHPQYIIIFESVTRIVFNEGLYNLFMYLSLIVGEINSKAVLWVPNITTWVKWRLALIYDRICINAYPQHIILFKSGREWYFMNSCKIYLFLPLFQLIFYLSK